VSFTIYNEFVKRFREILVSGKAVDLC